MTKASKIMIGVISAISVAGLGYFLYRRQTQKISKYLYLDDVIESGTAKKLNLENQPTTAQLKNIKLLAQKIFDPVYEFTEGQVDVNSFFRSDAVNEAVDGQPNSQHKANDGSAMDIRGTGKYSNSQIFEYIKKNLSFDQLIWEYGDSKNPQWIHVSYRSPEKNRKNIFSIS